MEKDKKKRLNITFEMPKMGWVIVEIDSTNHNNKKQRKKKTKQINIKS